MKRILSILFTLTMLTCYSADLLLSWQYAPTGAPSTGAIVYVAPGLTAPFAIYGRTSGTNLTITNLSAGVWRFGVASSNEWGDSAMSSPLTFTGSAPNAPISVTIQVTITVP